MATTGVDNNSESSSSGSSSYYWPAEWSRHSATILLYPHNPRTFRPAARDQFARVVQAILGDIDGNRVDGNEDVLVFSPHAVPELEALDRRVKVITCPSNDSWARDTGPTIVIAENSNTTTTTTTTKQFLMGIDWDFNCYGGPTDGCYWPGTLDQELAGKMCDYLKISSQRKVALVLEGGSIHGDGQGTILTTEECLLNRNRNPSFTKQEIENIVLETTGGSKMIWLPLGLANDDDTNGHIDNFACFVRPQHIVLAWTDDEIEDSENYKRCRQALQVLEKETDAQGNPLTVHKLYLPKPMFYTQEIVDCLNAATASTDSNFPSRVAGEQMAASYVNFYIANTIVVVPQFGDPINDHKAVETLQKLFPERRVVGVESKEILIGGGNIHCITQQVPAAP